MVTGQDYQFIRELRKESAAERSERHELIAKRRAGPMIIVHRGASSIAPENTLEAYAAAMDYGADGCEVDLRLTHDGVIVMFHDDMLDHLTESFGDIGELTFHETQRLRHRLLYGRKLRSMAPPTFVALLEVARQRAMLLHLDVKNPGMDREVARLLNEADVWDHIVAVNSATAPLLAKNPKLKPLRYRTGLYENRRDVDPEAVRAFLPAPGEMIILDDPRVAALALHRSPFRPVALDGGLCEPMGFERATPAPVYEGTNFNLFACTREWGKLREGEALVILTRDFPDGSQPAAAPAQERKRTEVIVQRAWAAQNVMPSWKSSRLIMALRHQVRNRSLHANWRFHGLDGAAAVRALGRLKDSESAGPLAEMFELIDPSLEKVNSMASYGDYPLSWQDAVFKMYIIPVLGELRCSKSKEFLTHYISLTDSRARAWAPVQWEEATKALLGQKLTNDELHMLLQNSNSAIRGTAILELIDHPGRAGTRALKEKALWALQLPKAN
jgi:hypothetical protein